MESWESLNEDIRDLWYNSYFEYHKFTKHNDVNGVEYLQYSKNDLEYKFYFPKDDEVVRSNLASMLNDILLPALLDDTHYVCEGPYEHGHGKLKKAILYLTVERILESFLALQPQKGAMFMRLSQPHTQLQY